MGFKDWLIESPEKKQARELTLLALTTFSPSGGPIKFSHEYGTVTYQGDSVPLNRIADVEWSAIVPETRMTATRIVAGAILLGPIGMVIGAFAKKQRNGDGWVLISIRGLDGEIEKQWLLEVKRHKAAEAQKFVVSLLNLVRQAKSTS